MCMEIKGENCKLVFSEDAIEKLADLNISQKEVCNIINANAEKLTLANDEFIVVGEKIAVAGSICDNKVYIQKIINAHFVF